MTSADLLSLLQGAADIHAADLDVPGEVRQFQGGLDEVQTYLNGLLKKH